MDNIQKPNNTQAAADYTTIAITASNLVTTLILHSRQIRIHYCFRLHYQVVVVVD